MGRRGWSSQLTIFNLAVPRIARRVVLARLNGLTKERVEEVFEPQRVTRRNDHVLGPRLGGSKRSGGSGGSAGSGGSGGSAGSGGSGGS